MTRGCWRVTRGVGDICLHRCHPSGSGNTNPHPETAAQHRLTPGSPSARQGGRLGHRLCHNGDTARDGVTLPESLPDPPAVPSWKAGTCRCRREGGKHPWLCRHRVTPRPPVLAGMERSRWELWCHRPGPVTNSPPARRRGSPTHAKRRGNGEKGENHPKTKARRGGGCAETPAGSGVEGLRVSGGVGVVGLG